MLKEGEGIDGRRRRRIASRRKKKEKISCQKKETRKRD